MYGDACSCDQIVDAADPVDIDIPDASIEVPIFQLPPGWIEWVDVQENRPKKEERYFLNHILVDSKKAMLRKSVTVNWETKTFTRYLMSSPIDNLTTFHDVSEVDELFCLYNQQEICKGISDEKFRNIGLMNNGDFRDDVSRSKR